MATRVVAIVAAVVVTGCGQRQDSFPCTDDASCGVGGKCEPGFNLCSFANSSCPSGRAFGDLGGASSGQCVGSQPMPDAGPPDVPPDARVCFGAAPFTVCFTAPPTGAIDVSTPTTFDTVTGTVTGTQLSCTTPMSGGTGYCVIAADTITITAPLRAIGMKPLVLVAATLISVPITGSIDVASHRLPTESIGAGAATGTACNAGTPPATNAGTSGGGAGGSFIGNGGNGGTGGGANGGNGGQRGGAVGGTITVIRGGCPGQDGAGGGRGAHGNGGGAVFLIAGVNITVGGTINAGGEGGAGGNGMDSGGGGGGAGGMLGFDAPTIAVTGTLIANGGGGAEGSGNSADGTPGADAVTTGAALGGAGGSNIGGDGGGGSAGAAGGPGTPGVDGNASGGGGGGGGGGAGLIKGPAASLGTNVSPAPTP